MKLLLMLIAIGIIGVIAYYFSAKLTHHKKSKKFNWKPLSIAAAVVIFLLALFAFGLYKAATQPDMQCGTTHTTSSTPPSTLQTASDYFALGNYDYDKGNCQRAVVDYTRAITLNPNYPQAYNNRAYTYMRMREYNTALPDLDKALELKPNYIQALMNRADVHNYYYQIDRQSAIRDYKKARTLGATQEETSVCGHLFLAEHNGWTFGAYLDLLRGAFATCE